MGNEACVAYDRRACEGLEDLPRAAPVTGCGPAWIPEAASCLTSKAPVNQKVDRWLVDTGCGYDLVSKEHTAATRRWVRKAVHPRTFQTANGVTTTDKVARMTVDEFGEEVAPYILDSTPPVLSVGYRCMNLGYSLIWPKGEDPYFLLPNGSICPLVTKGDVPYLYHGNSQCQPKTSKKTRCFACICQEVPLPLLRRMCCQKAGSTSCCRYEFFGKTMQGRQDVCCIYCCPCG